MFPGGTSGGAGDLLTNGKGLLASSASRRGRKARGTVGDGKLSSTEVRGCVVVTI